ncbi:MAG TPA: alpha-amylase/4-alpha-glucanotransferase domain-containing protein, partial [Spirochaetia bacterium]|nr:alpha-amylase/4-alpha-glucanotransferase domain-containing protein [Spirochaetia bacterium]
PRYARKAFLDHFFGTPYSIEDFHLGRYEEAGDFLGEPYDLVELNRTLPELLLRRTGAVSAAGQAHGARIEKRFVFRPRSIDVYYKVTNLAASNFSARFGVEMNVSLAERSVECGRFFLLDEDRTTEIGSERQDIDGVQGLLVRDVRNEVSITLSSAKAFRFWGMPLETAVPGAEDQPPVFQSHCLVQLWDLSLRPGESWENHLSLGFEKTQDRSV